MEALFLKYMEAAGINSKPVFTYDSINYHLHTNYHIRELEVFDFSNGNLFSYPSLQKTPETYLREIYTSDDLYYHVLGEISQLKTGEKLRWTSFPFVPVNLKSVISVDLYFEHIIKKFDLASLIMESKMRQDLFPEFNDRLLQASKDNSGIFTKHFIKAVMEGLQILFKLHHWHMYDGAKYDDLDNLIEKFVNTLICSPGQLQGYQYGMKF